MKTKYSALLLATSLLAAPAWLMAEPAAEQSAQASATNYQHKMQRNGEGHKAKSHGNMYQHGYQHQQMNPEKFANYLTKRLENLETPELKAQFIKASQARLTAQAEQAQLKTMMAEQKAQGITDKALKEATLEKIAADQKLKQLRSKQLQDVLTKATH